MTAKAAPQVSGDTAAELADLRNRLAASEGERARLTYELGHRVKNTLGVVQALAGQTLRAVATPQEAAETLTHRILALSRASDAILKDAWTTAGLRTVAEHVLRPDGLSAAGTLAIAGPDLSLRAGAALSVGMALHELASNAGRHGAWSRPGGRVDLSWAAQDDRFALAWTEHGGPPAAEPAKRRFGLRLVEQSLRSAFGGDVTLAFGADGFSCRAAAPLAKVTGNA